MSSTKTTYQHSRWHLVTAIATSLLALLFIAALMNGAVLSASPGTSETDRLQAVTTNQSTAPTRTILVGMTKEASTDIISAAVQVKPVLSLGETTVANAATNPTSRLGQIYKFELEPGADMAATIRQLEANPTVLFAEPDYLAHLITVPDDPLYNEQWGLAKINAPAAWDVTTGNSNVIIAVIDSGLDTTHPDLTGQLWTNPGEIAGNGLDDDNNGYVDDIHGWNMVDNNADLSDNTGHGTEVAGVIGAVSNNGLGIAGVCWNCRLMTLKVTQSGGIANYSDIIEAIQYATLKGADVINLSLGGASDSVSLRLAVDMAAETTVVVGGAGNDDDSALFYPAAYESVLAVAGTSVSDVKVGSSNYGSWVDVAAPGEMITTTFDGGSYGMTSGTSMAAPFASGLAGLLRSAHPDWSANSTRAQLIQTTTAVDNLNPGYEGLLGSGRIDAAQALTISSQPDLYYVSHEVNDVINGRPEPGSSIDLNVTLANNWADAANVQTTLSSADPYVTIVNNAASYGSIDTFNSAANLTPFQVTISSAAPYAYDLAFMLNVTADGSYETAVPITITTAMSEIYPPATITTQTWTNDRIYVINKETGVPVGETLTIEPGTVIRFDGDFSLHISGELIADGTVEQPILFTSNQGTPVAGDWGRIVIEDSSNDALVDAQQDYISGTILRHCIIDYGEGIFAQSAAPFIAQNIIQHSVGDWGVGGIQVTGDVSSPLVVANNNILGFLTVSIWNGTQFYVSDNSIQGFLQADGPGGIIDGNRISWLDDPGPTTGLYSWGTISVTNNVVQGWGNGLVVADVITVSGNLLANNTAQGLVVESGSSNIAHNTIINNGETAVYIQSGSPKLHQNNLIPGVNGLAINNQSTEAIDATGNWWGTTNTSNIESIIYDGRTEFGLGVVDYNNFLPSSDTIAPAYLHNVIISPESPIGIETATFNLQFSRPVDQSINPIVSFHDARRGTWEFFDTDTDNLPYPHISSVAVDNQGIKWFGGGKYTVNTGRGGVSSFDGTNWETFDAANTPLPDFPVTAIAIDANNVKWIGTDGGGIVRFDGVNWTVFSEPPNNYIKDIAIDNQGIVWCATQFGVASYDGISWTSYSEYNSPLIGEVLAIAVDSDNTKWFGSRYDNGSLFSFDGANWVSHDIPTSSPLMLNTIAVDHDNVIWVGLQSVIGRYDGANWVFQDSPITDIMSINIASNNTKWVAGYSFGINGVVSFDGEKWRIYGTDNSDCESTRDIAIDWTGDKWIACGNLMQGGAMVFYDDMDFLVTDNADWEDSFTWHSSYDITSLIPRGDYLVEVTGAKSLDGMEIPVDSRFGFSVDYAGEITVQTPPAPPIIWAGGIQGDPSGMEAFWLANDTDSSITGFRFALGSAPGATDIINWTTTSETSLQLSGLGLVEGQQYWLAVQARNAGGLWSASAYGGFVAGRPLSRIFLPIVTKL